MAAPWTATRETWADQQPAPYGPAALAWQRAVEAAWRAGEVSLETADLSESVLLDGRFETGARTYIDILERQTRAPNAPQESSAMSMLAVTLYPEWVPTFPILGKDIENRDWWQERLQGQLVALHAGQAWGGRRTRTARQEAVRGVAAFARQRGVEEAAVRDYERAASGVLEGWPDEPRGSVQVVARVGRLYRAPELPPELRRWAMEGSSHRWHCPEVYHLRRPVYVPPGGFHAGLWTLPPAVEADVVGQLRELGAAVP